MNTRGGRGGRYLNYRREENLERREPHGDNVKEFFLESEPDSRRRGDKDNQGIRLHVSNISSNMSEISLRRLFSEFGHPTIFLNNSSSYGNNDRSKYNWAFVDFPTSYEAHNAMSSLNRTAPHHLNVKLARTHEDSELQDFKKEIQPCSDSENVRGKGRGARIPLVGRSPKSYHSIKPLMENYSCNEVKEDQYSNSRFQHDGTPSDIVDTNEVYGRMTKISQGKRSVSMGRGVNKNDRVEKYTLPEISSRVHQNIDNFITNSILKPTKDDLRSYPPDMEYPFQTGKCPNCSRSSTYICCNCKEWYCSMDCAREHLAKYGNRCPNRKVTRDEGQTDSNVSQDNDDDDYLINKKYFSKQVASPTFQPEVRGKDCPDKQRNRRSNNSRQSSDRGDDYEDSSPKPRKEGGGGGGNNHRGSQPIGQRLKRMSGTNSEYNDSDSNSNQMRNTAQNRRGMGGDQHNRGGTNNKNNRNAKNNRSNQERRFAINRNSQHDSDVYVRNESKEEASSEKSTTLNIGDVEEVIVSSVTNENNVFWVYNKSSLLDMAETLKAVERIQMTAKTLASPSEDIVCAAPFGDEWYRAKILRCSQDNALVRFIDYGNVATVSFSKLKALPKDLGNKQPLAFKIRIKGAPVKLTENEEISIKLISMSSDTWNVNLVNTKAECSGQSSNVNDRGESTISFDHFDLVHIMEGSNGEFYVQLEYNVVKLVKMSDGLGKHSSEKVEPKLGELYVKYYSDTWCRALVVDEMPLTVNYIDFGNSEVVQSGDLHPVPREYKDIPALAVKIKLADGTPSKYMNKKFSESLQVKAMAKLQDGTWLVHVKDENTELDINEEINPKSDYADQRKKVKHAIELLNDGDDSVLVCVRKALSNECLSGSIIINEHYPDYYSTAEISALLRNTEQSKNYKTKVGDLVIARVGSTWCRGYIMLMTDGEINVALIDFAEVIKVEENNIKLLPVNYHTVPVRLAVRVVLETSLDSSSAMIGNTIKLTNIKRKGDIVKCTFGVYGEAEICSWTPLIEEAGLRVFPLKNNTHVVISSFHTPRSVYLRSAAEQDITKLAELLQDITRYSVKAEPLNRKPIGGEMVCAKYNEDGMYYRAQIFQKAEGELYKVNFVDFGNTEIVSATDMQLLPDTFKKVPCFAVKVGLKDLIAHTFNPQAMAHLNKLTLSESVLLLTYDDLSEVTLVSQNGQVLNVTLVELMEHSLKTLKMPQGEGVQKLHPFMGQDVVYENWPVRSRVNVVVISVENFRTFLALDQSSKLINHIINYLTPKINKYCIDSAQNSYNPRINEMILAKYKDDGEEQPSWYRAICIKAMMSSSFILFIDYGNCGEVSHTDIRSMPAEFMDTPAALKRCTVYGISDSLSRKVKDEVQGLLEGFQGEAIIVEDHDNGNATLWIPSLYPKLEADHPPIDPPVGF